MLISPLYAIIELDTLVKGVVIDAVLLVFDVAMVMIPRCELLTTCGINSVIVTLIVTGNVASDVLRVAVMVVGFVSCAYAEQVAGSKVVFLVPAIPLYSTRQFASVTDDIVAVLLVDPAAMTMDRL